MATIAKKTDADIDSSSFVPKHWRERQPKGAIDHIPGEEGLPFIGNTFKLLADPHGFSAYMYKKYGPVSRNHAFGGPGVMLIGADANELVLFDRNKIFSSEQGWGPILGMLFPRGLMLMDFDHHRADRRALSIAFKPGPMRHYADTLNTGVVREVEKWAGPMAFYPAIKRLTLDLAATSFIGIEWGPEADKINEAFVYMVQASVAPVRWPLPFTLLRKGVKSREFLVDYFTEETLRRRKEGGGQDMFSQFANATHEDGSLLAVDEVVDHMNFLMMAAHDTITSSVTTMVYLLAKNPEWQEKLRREITAVTGGEGRSLSYDDLGKLELTEMAFKEALRFAPPVPSTPRRALKDFEFGGFKIPSGTPISINAHAVHHSPEYWPEPEKFDPMRFTPEAIKARHKYAWVPFGGGAHMCLGLHFAYMQVKVLMAHILTRYEIEVEENYAPEWKAWPIPQPKDGLQVNFKPL